MIGDFESRREKRINQEAEFKERISKTSFEKGDLPALIIAALTSILPFAVIVFIVLFFLPMIIFRWI